MKVFNVNYETMPSISSPMDDSPVSWQKYYQGLKKDFLTGIKDKEILFDICEYLNINCDNLDDIMATLDKTIQYVKRRHDYSLDKTVTSVYYDDAKLKGLTGDSKNRDIVENDSYEDLERLLLKKRAREGKELVNVCHNTRGGSLSGSAEHFFYYNNKKDTYCEIANYSSWDIYGNECEYNDIRITDYDKIVREVAKALNDKYSSVVFHDDKLQKDAEEMFFKNRDDESCK